MILNNPGDLAKASKAKILESSHIVEMMIGHDPN